MRSSVPDRSFFDQEIGWAIRVHGRDRRGNKVLVVIGKLFPARVNGEILVKYLMEKVFPELNGENRFSVLYVHTGVQRADNYPGFSFLKSVLDAIPLDFKNRLDSIFFLHPGFQARLSLAVLGRVIFSGGLYGKIKYVNRVEFLWDHLRRTQLELPEFAYDQDEETEFRPVVDYGPESDNPRLYCGSSLDHPLSSYSMRCIA